MSADLENLNKCLRQIAEIRAKTSKLFSSAAAGVGGAANGITGSNNDSKEKKFISEFKGQLDDVQTLIGDLETTLSNQQPISNPLPLGHSVYLSLDAAIENIPIYNKLVTSYRWLDKVHDYSTGAALLLSQNSLNRSYGKFAKSNRKKQTSTLALGSSQ